MSPPDIAGYRFERLLGSGGYSDVFLYEQEMPRRFVAIKVLLADRLDDRSLRLVSDEANAMAAVSTHPYIVTIFHADVGTGGNPFLVMEYYPRPNYSVRARTEQLSLAEVLRAGIQVASAVETAHRAGIIHRDIKPSNILTSEYGRPGLTDFGIAGLEDGSTDPAEGLSVPWSPPEIITGDGVGGVTSDVYSLGATIYSLLVGRSPYEVVGGSNSTLDLLERIQRGELPPTGRGDTPPSLERLLRHAMARRPEDRPASAADLARALQDIEVQQQFAMTPLEVRDDGGTGLRSRAVDGDEDGTRLKAPTVIYSQDPTGSVADGARATRPDGGETRHRDPSAAGLVLGVPGVAPESATVQRSSVVDPRFGAMPPPSAPAGVAPMPLSPASSDGTASAAGEADAVPTPHAAPAARRGRQVGLVQVAAGALLVLALLVGVRLAIVAFSPDDDGTTGQDDAGDGDVVGGEVVDVADVPPPMAVAVVATPTGELSVTWTAADAAAAADYYTVSPVGGSVLDDSTVQTEAGQLSATMPAGAGCVEVRAVHNGVQSQPVEACPGEPVHGP